MPDGYFRPPFIQSLAAQPSQYRIVRDYDEPYPTDDQVFGRTEVRIAVDGSGANRAQIIAPFPARVWFRRVGGTTGTPEGELIFELHPIRSLDLASDLVKADVEVPTFLACSPVTLDAAEWKVQFQSSLSALQGQRLHDEEGRRLGTITGSPETIFDQYFLTGLVAIDVAGSDVDEAFPLVLATTGEVTYSLLLAQLRSPDSPYQKPPSVQGLLAWSLRDGNVAKQLEEFAAVGGALFVAPIPLGHFYSSVDKGLFPPPYVEHPFLRALADASPGLLSSAVNSMWKWVGASAPRWRRIYVTTNHTPRISPAFWTAWPEYDLVVDGDHRTIQTYGQTYWRLRDGMATIAVEHKASHTLVRVRSFLGDPFADEMTAPIADGVDVPVIADLDAAFLVVDTKTGLQFETHRSPLDLLTDTSLDPKRRYGAYTTLYSTQSQEAATKAVFELCPGKSGQAVFKSTKDLYGLAQPGSQTMAGAIERFSQVLGWSDDQRTVLSAVSANEGKLDSVNTWDRAFLSFGILQWALFTSDAEGGGELAALLEFIDRNDPARYEEYFGQFGLQYVDVGPHRDDLVPRGWTKLDSTVLDGRALKDAMRGYDWTTYFRAAGFDPAVQLLELRFAYERFKQLRELTITLTDGVEYSIGDLFTSQHSVALLYDQYTNLPPKLAPNIKSAIGNRLPSGGRFEGDTLTAIIDAYASSRDVIKDANNNDYRRDQINTWNLSTSAGTFVWPT